MHSLDSPSTITDTATAVQRASKVKKVHFRLSQQFVIIYTQQHCVYILNYRNYSKAGQIFFLQISRNVKLGAI